MDKFKYSFLLLLFAFFSLLTYALVKAWVRYGEQGIDLKEEAVEENTQVSAPVNLPSNDIVENSKIIWKNFLYYPIEPSSEEGSFGPKKHSIHAKNLTFVNLLNGRVKKLFDKKVYIWDFFPGEFTKISSSSNRTYELESSQSENLNIDIGQRFILLVITKDTNGDGFLNQKDKLKVFIYEPNSETLSDILPEGFYFEKLLYNSKKDTLVMIVSQIEKLEKPKNSIFIYEVNTQKSIFVTP
ncbi:MAG: hypothetical protein N3A69_09735 [Leptospiraceae bacterium]|nr:hypothetical protein [Leptospiraceae bacterium]